MIADEGIRVLTIAARFGRRLVLGPEIAALDLQLAITINTDECAGAGDLLRVVDDGPVLEGIECRLDLGETPIDLLGQILVAFLEIALFDLLELRPQGFAAGVLLVGQRLRFAHDAAQAGSVAIGEVRSDLDPVPALGLDCLGLGRELLGDKLLQQRHILEPAFVILREQVAEHDAASFLIGREPDEAGTLVGGADGVFRQQLADEIGLLVVAALHGLPDLFLPGMVVRNREGHQLLQRHAVIGIDFQQLGRHAGELQPLLDDLRRHEEAGGDLLLAHSLFLQRLEGTELIHRVE